MTELTPLIPAPSITKLLPTITDKQVKWMIIKGLLSRFRCKIFARCCGYPACAPPPGVCPKFRSFADAVARVADGETLSFVGMAGNLPVVGFWFALVKRYQAEGHPKNLTVVCHGGNGGRGKLPGSLDDVLKLKGCVTRFITAHCDTHIFAKKRMLDPADRLEIQQLPLGTMSLIYKSMAAGGPPSHTSTTGVDTVFDPRVGRGSFVTPGLTTGQLIRAEVDGRLTYSLPLFNACMLNCAAADPDGNVYCRGQSMISDAKEQALAVKRNGGTVYVTVGLLVPKGCAAVRRPPFRRRVPSSRLRSPYPSFPGCDPAAQLAPRPHLSHDPPPPIQVLRHLPVVRSGRRDRARPWRRAVHWRHLRRAVAVPHARRPRRVGRRRRRARRPFHQ